MTSSWKIREKRKDDNMLEYGSTSSKLVPLRNSINVSKHYVGRTQKKRATCEGEKLETIPLRKRKLKLIIGENIYLVEKECI